MFISGGLRSLNELLKMNVILWKQMCFVPSPRQKCMARTSFLIEPWMAKHFGTCWLRGLCHNWNMTVLTLSISWLDPHATITVMLGTSLTRLPHRWIGRGVNNGQHLLLWPPRSPDLTPCDFFLWGYVKRQCLQITTPPKCARPARSHSSCGAKPLMGTCWSASGRS